MQKPLSEQIRDFIRASGLSMYALAQLASIDKSLLSRFLAVKSSLSLQAVDRLGEVLALRIASSGPSSGSQTKAAMSGASTVGGYVNKHGQRVIGRTKLPAIHGQYVYELECTECGQRYGAFGCDIAGANKGSGRKCPACQGGAPGHALTELEK